MTRLHLSIVLLFCSITAWATNKSNEFDVALQLLVQDCPEIEILKKNNEANIAVQKSLNKLSSPEVEIDQLWGRNGVGNKFDLTVTQAFDWPGLYRARAKAINAQTNANFLLEQTNLLDKIQEVRSLMVDIIFQKKNISLSQMIYNHMLELENANKESYERGETSKLELKKTQLERVQAAIQLRENERMLNELYTSLDAATGKNNSREIMDKVSDVPESLIESEENYELKVNNYDPRMSYLKATLEAVNATSKVEKMSSTLPSFNLGYLFQREQGETFNGFSVSFSLPIYGNSHVVRASKANVISAQLEIQVEQIAILSKMRNRRLAALSLARELEDYSTIFEKGNYAELLKLALDGGQTDNIHYLQELNYYTEVTRQYLELQHQYNLAMVDLTRYDIFSEDGRNF